jgi:quinol monooxygenase YgiN
MPDRVFPVTQDQKDPTRFRFFEVFRSQEALATHFATTVASLGRFEAGRENVLVSPAVLEKHVLVDDVAPPKSRL